MIVESVRTVKARFSEFLDLVVREREQVTITRNGRPEAVLLSLAQYESMRLALDFLSNPRAVAAVRGMDDDVAAGRFADEDELRRLQTELEERIRRRRDP